MPNYEVPTVPSSMYSSPDHNVSLPGEDILAYVSDRPMEHIPYQGTLIHIQGATYPKKGWVTPEIIAQLNIIKKLILLATYFPLPIGLAFLFQRNRLLQAFNTLFDKAMHQYTLNEEYLCPAAYNLSRFIYLFLTASGITPYLAKETGHNLAHLIEYDDAYRYRLQDIMSEANLTTLQNSPKYELNRLLSILIQRTPPKNGVDKKLRRLIEPFILLLLIPRYKKAFQVSAPHLYETKYDDADRYWASLKGDDYLFTGQPYEDRTRGLQIPVPVKVNY